MSTRAAETGWELVAMHDPADRRGIWMRYNKEEDSFEICAGREGDDLHIKLTVGETVSPRHISKLREIMNLGIWAIDLALDDEKMVSTWAKKE